MKKYIVVALVLLAFTAKAQEDILTGTVHEIGSNKKLEDVFIKDINNKQITLTDKRGRYTISTATGHTLIFSSPGYVSDTLYLINMQPKFIELKSMSISLNQVDIRSSRAAFDPRAEYPEVYRKAKIYPLSPSTIFSREARNARKLKRYFAHEQEERYVDDIYTKLYVSGIVPLKGMQLDEFMGMSRPSYELLKKTTGADLVLYVNDWYKKYKAMSPAQRSSLLLSSQ
ncbi:MAG: hypothetical protein ABI367_08515 [Mucilaginibacter sp.]